MLPLIPIIGLIGSALAIGAVVYLAVKLTVSFLKKYKQKKNSKIMAAQVKDLIKNAPTMSLDDLDDDDVVLAENHSKVMLIVSGEQLISVVTSQNQTYGGRSESTIVTTMPEIFWQLYDGFMKIVKEGVSMYGIHGKTTGTDNSAIGTINATFRDFRPFGAQE